MSGFGAHARDYDIKLFQKPFYRSAAGPDPLRTYAAAATSAYRRNAPAIRDMRFRRSNEYDPDRAIRSQREDLISDTYFKNEKNVDLEGLRGRLGLQLSRTGGALGKMDNKVLGRTSVAPMQASALAVGPRPPGPAPTGAPGLPAVGDVVRTPKGQTGVVDKVTRDRYRVTLQNPDGSPSKNRTWMRTPGNRLGGAMQPTVAARRMSVTSARRRRDGGNVSRLVDELERGRSSEARMLSFGPEPQDETPGFTGPEAVGKIEQMAKRNLLMREMGNLKKDSQFNFFKNISARGGRRSGAGAASKPLPFGTPKPKGKVVKFSDYLQGGTGADTSSPSTLAAAFGTGAFDFD